MKSKNIIISEKKAKAISNIAQGICYVAIAFMIYILFQCVIGRLSYDVHAPTANYENVSYSENGLTVSGADQYYVRTQLAGGSIELSTYITLVAIYGITIILAIIAFWFLSKVFANVAKGEIFVQKNAQYLMYYGVIQLISAVVLPFAKVLFVNVVNMFLADTISISTGLNTQSQLFQSFAFLVAAYIIHYGVHLQDEVDHTL